MVITRELSGGSCSLLDMEYFFSCHFPTQSSHCTGLLVVKVKFTVLRINEISEDIQLVFKVGQKV